MYGNTPGERSSEGQITSFTTKYRRDIYLWLYLTPPLLRFRNPGNFCLWICGFWDLEPEIQVTVTGMVWPVSSDEWKVP